MKQILEELKGSITGVIGSFVVGDGGDVVAQDVPELMSGATEMVSKTLYHVINVIRENRSINKITVDSENAKLITFPLEGRLLVVILEKTINQPLFKLMSNMAISKIKEAPTPATQGAAKAGAPDFDVGKICDTYDKLFGAAAKRLANIIGPKSAVHFTEGSEEVRNSYPAIFEGVQFGTSGKPDMTKIRENARNVSSEDELTEALDELLLSMLDTVRNIAGPKQEQKAMDEIQNLKG